MARPRDLWPSRVCKLLLHPFPSSPIISQASPCISCITRVVSSRLLSELRPLSSCALFVPPARYLASRQELFQHKILREGIPIGREISASSQSTTEKAENQCWRGCAWERSVRGCATLIFTLEVASVLQPR